MDNCQNIKAFSDLDFQLKEIKEKCSTEIFSVEKAFEDLSEENRSKLAELEKLELELERERKKETETISLQEQIRNLDEEISFLNSQIKEKFNSLSVLKEKEGILESTILISKELSNSNIEFNEKFESLLSLSASYNESKALEDSLKEKVETLAYEIEEFKRSKEDVDAERYSLKAALDLMEEERDNVQSEIDKERRSEEEEKRSLKVEIKELEREYMEKLSRFTNTKGKLLRKNMQVRDAERIDIDSIIEQNKELDLELYLLSGSNEQIIHATNPFNLFLKENEELKSRIYKQELILCEHSIMMERIMAKATKTRYIR